MPPRRRERAGVVAEPGGVIAQRAAQPPASQPHGDGHLGPLELDIGYGDARQAYQAMVTHIHAGRPEFSPQALPLCADK